MKRAVGGLLLVGALSACGSTVQVRSSAPSLERLGAAPTSAATTSGSLDGLGGGTGAGALPTTTGATRSATGSAGAPTTAAGGLGAPAGSGATAGSSHRTTTSAKPVRVGVLYATGVDTVAKSFGISGLTTGDTKAQAAAVISYLNTHGGLAGRPIAPVYYGISASDDANNPDGAFQAACTSLTQDGHVSYVVTILNLRPATLPCFAAAGVGLLDDGSNIADSTMARYASHFAAPGDFATGRVMKRMVDDLWNRGWLTPTSKVGSLTYDTPDGRSLVDGALTQALRAHGLSIASKQAVADDSSAITHASNVALQFRSAGVDRVIPVTASPLFVMEAASSQKYYPAYAMFSSFGPGALIESAAPKDQLKNSAGIGWQPFLDIGAGTHPGPVSPAETLCFALMRSAGQQSSAATVKGFEVQVCNVLFYLQAAAARLGSVRPDLLVAARPALGAGYRPADTFRSDMTEHNDGAAGFRSLAYETSCSCYQYVSGVKTAS